MPSQGGGGGGVEFGSLQSWYQSLGFRSYMGAVSYGVPLWRED